MPLAGHDTGGLLSAPIVEGNFNPRAPCGVRPYAATWLSSKGWISIHVPLAGHDGAQPKISTNGILFQSTCPLRGTTSKVVTPSRIQRISIHMPLAGHDCTTTCPTIQKSYFNPHAPCGARQLAPVSQLAAVAISIHMPLAGHDAGTPACPAWRPGDFNPRAPCGARR